MRYSSRTNIIQVTNSGGISVEQALQVSNSGGIPVEQTYPGNKFMGYSSVTSSIQVTNSGGIPLEQTLSRYQIHEVFQ